jgi:hypothetical protein
MQAYFIFVFKREPKQSNHLLCGQLFQKNAPCYIHLASKYYFSRTDNFFELKNRIVIAIELIGAKTAS